MKHQLLLLASVVLICLVGVLLARAAQSQSATGKLSADDAVALMRLVNTAQAVASPSGGSYVSLNKLLEVQPFKGRQMVSGVGDDASGTIKDYTLTVIASTDGKHYQAKLVPADGCGRSFFTSDPGVIYQAQALGCEGK